METEEDQVDSQADAPLEANDATMTAELGPIHHLTAEQNAEAAEYALEFLRKVLRIRGVRINRDAFLRQELRKLGIGDEAISAAIASTPVAAGLSMAQLDEVANRCIHFETNKSAATSFAAGLPGGFTMFAMKRREFVGGS